MNDTIVMPGVWQWTGVRHLQITARAKEFLSPEPVGPVEIGFWWPASAVFFSLDLRSDDGAEFSPVKTREEKAGGRPFGLVPLRGIEGKLSPGSRFTLELFVDTDSHEFRRQAERVAADSASITIPIVVMIRPPEEGSDAVTVRQLTAQIEPGAPMPVLDGFVGLDLGNVNSALACLPATSEYRVEPIGINAAPGVIPSAVRILRYVPAPSEWALDTATYIVGEGALTPKRALGLSNHGLILDANRLLAGGDQPLTSLDRSGSFVDESEDSWLSRSHERHSDGWLILGAKRLLAGKEEVLTIWVRGERHDVDKRFPAELLLAALFRLVHIQNRRVPRQIAVTCPTTFSAWEVEQLRRAVLQGWRRSLGATRKEPARIPEDLPAVVLDEASAAALYLFHRDFLGAPGGLAAFEYLYPHGMNLLVYDCGGGSTDVALVRAALVSGDRRRVRLQVLGRAGLSHFGGDDITAATARILKAKIAQRLTRLPRAANVLLQPIPNTAVCGMELDEYLQIHADAIDRLVPTRFDPSRLDADGDSARRRGTALWGLAEVVKCCLQVSSTISLRDQLDSHHPLSHSLATLYGTTPDEIVMLLLSVEVRDVEVNGLINGAIEASVDQANRLIVSRLPEGNLDRIYLIGNSSRYPAVRAMIAKRLNVAFPMERIHWSDGPDLKMAVSKGAALAVGLLTRLSGVRVEFDGGYMSRLPFDVGYADYTIGAVRILFREWEAYDKLMPQLIPVPTAGRPSSLRMITLSRRWPGEPNFSPYLSFHFSQAIGGPVRVWFAAGVSAPNQFLMRDEMTGLEAVGVEVTPDLRETFRNGVL